MTFEANKEEALTHHGTTCIPLLGTGLAWDNWKFLATMTGTDTHLKMT